jgi:hypothetical protein
MSVEELAPRLSESHPEVRFWNVLQTPNARFDGEKVEFSGESINRLAHIDCDGSIRAMEGEAAGFDLSAVALYFEASGFQDAFELFLMVCDDDFAEAGDGLIINFSGDRPTVRPVPSGHLERRYEDAPEDASLRRKLIKIRREVLWHVIQNRLPWEEAMIGFQCRFKRKPDFYNHGFWRHFSKVYVA